MIIDSDFFEYLIGEMRQERLNVFVGSATSLPFASDPKGKKYPGLISASEFVREISKGRAYIGPNLAFPEACEALKNREGRASLERHLVGAFDKPTIEPTPAHNLLASLPFSSYITTNYDTMIERSLVKMGRSPHSLILDKDVSHLKKRNTVVVKYHGCVTRPETMIAARSDYLPLDKSKPVIFSSLVSQLAHKTLLVVGFALEDDDFKSVIQVVQDAMGEHAPKIIAVVKAASKEQKQKWEQDKNVMVVEADLTGFLRTFSAMTANPKINDTVYVEKDDWLRNAFFVSLHDIRTRPSETQVVDAYIAHLKDELSRKNADVAEIINSADKAADLVLGSRPNYVALKKESTKLLAKLKKSKAQAQAEAIVDKVIRERNMLALSFEKLGVQLVKRNESILLFSQSKRVIQALRGVPHSTQSTCHLFIAECRPKSPKPFQDAISICELLAGTQYRLTIIPDVAIGNLFERSQINLVLLGAHAIYTEKKVPYAFINTCGTNLIVNAAYLKKIPVKILAEKVKFIELKKTDVASHVSYEEEEELFDSLGYGEETKSKALWVNIGYDLCFINEKNADVRSL